MNNKLHPYQIARLKVHILCVHHDIEDKILSKYGAFTLNDLLEKDYDFILDDIEQLNMDMGK